MATVPLIICIGESNSRGFAPTSGLLPADFAVTPQVQILDTSAPLVFSDLEIGVNQHNDDLNDPNDPEACGFEAGLRRQVVGGGWQSSYVYLVKRGQGGSTVGQWGSGGAYINALQASVTAALAAISDAGDTPLITFWLSIGLNDMQQSTSAAELQDRADCDDQ